MDESADDLIDLLTYECPFSGKKRVAGLDDNGELSRKRPSSKPNVYPSMLHVKLLSFCAFSQDPLNLTILLLLHKLRKLKVEPPEDQDELQYKDYFDRSGPSKRPPCMAITAAT